MKIEFIIINNLVLNSAECRTNERRLSGVDMIKQIKRKTQYTTMSEHFKIKYQNRMDSKSKWTHYFMYIRCFSIQGI
jgi:hypothetical protein